ncbi:hypothetical protein [Enterococcus phage EFGrKN]|uniref:Uncharacterized protein n=1 Tax=Enterococcus phage EFGrKN TaxID=2777300 RepID=A0A7S6R6G6_9CAUD|nr:hypothetical protein [Enterococcus phage EFGrKN]
MNLGTNETQNRIIHLLDYTKEHLYEIDNRIKLTYYKPIFYDLEYDRLIIRLRFAIFCDYTIERVITIGWDNIDYYSLATDEFYIAKYVGERLRVEIDYCSALADMFEHQSDRKVRLKRKYNEAKRNTRVLPRKFKPRTGNQRMKGRNK